MKVLLKMCGKPVKLSNKKKVLEKYCQVVAEDLVNNPTMKMSYEAITTRRKTTKQKNKSSRGKWPHNRD
jgi:hypothetical protein